MQRLKEGLEMATSTSKEDSAMVSSNFNGEQTPSSNEDFGKPFLPLATSTFEACLVCSECNGLFSKLSHLKLHSLTHIRNRKSRFLCPKTKCDEEFWNEDDFVVHFLSHSGENMTEHLVYDVRFPREENLAADGQARHKRYPCAECGMLFRLKATRRVHLRTHTGEKPYACPECNKRFTCRAGLNLHKITHSSEKPYACTQCDVRCTRKHHLINHIRSRHSSEKPFACPQCNKRFAVENYLIAHLQRHNDKNKYVCLYCNARYSCHSGLMVHLRRHNGEKLFACDQCPSRYYDNGGLKSHLRVHGAGKPLRCTECNASFGKNTNLSVHLKKHTMPFECTKCNERFTEERYLEDHMRIKRHIVTARSKRNFLKTPAK